jgi:23S rRNA (guanosine2251-2'-O)-methyltransferase
MPASETRSYGDERYVFGVNPVLELLRARPEQIDRLFMQQQGLKESIAGEVTARANEHRIRLERLPRERIDAMAPKSVHQGIAAEVRQYEYASLETILDGPRVAQRAGLVVVLDGIQDPMNLGAIVRSAYAFGADGVIIGKDRAAAVTGVVVKASAGATAHTKIARVTNLARTLDELKSAGYWSVATAPAASSELWKAPFDGSLAVVIGAEGAGVRQGLLERCDFVVRIPMVGRVASLNASVSAGVLLAEIARRREGSVSRT